MSEQAGPAPDVTPELRRSIRFAGLLGSIAALALLWVVGSITDTVPWPPLALAARLVRAAPGDVATFFIEALDHWALRLLRLGVVLGALAFGAEVLLRTAAGARIRPWAAGGILGGAAALASASDPSLQPDPGYVLIASSLSAALYVVVVRNVYRRATSPTIADTDPGRRRALRAGAGAVLGLAFGAGALGWLLRRLAGPNRDVELVAPRVPAAVPKRSSWIRIPGLSPEITSAEDHYQVDINLVPPSVEAAGWTLSVGGLVERQTELTFEELQRRFDVVEEYSTLTCVSNEVGGELVGHSAWGGVRLMDLLDAVVPQRGAVDVVFRAADGYSDSIPIELARDPQVILAVSQNGAPLTREHGFPCRVRVPPIYGMKNVKWLQAVEVVDSDYQGYWQTRGWSDDATVKTSSRIDVAARGARAGESTWIAGVAWAGDRGVSRVEVSVDGGRTWSRARLKDPIAESSWRQWALRWTPERSGRTVVSCRAVDGDGIMQIARLADPHPDGASGYHEVEVEVA
jgi:DMSO/TMAO reductase YedYZ molybdopterin-dependent catalytic subunit